MNYYLFSLRLRLIIAVKQLEAPSRETSTGIIALFSPVSTLPASVFEDVVTAATVVGATVDAVVGVCVGATVGAIVEVCVGATVGATVGAPVGGALLQAFQEQELYMCTL